MGRGNVKEKRRVRLETKGIVGCGERAPGLRQRAAVDESQCIGRWLLAVNPEHGWTFVVWVSALSEHESQNVRCAGETQLPKTLRMGGGPVPHRDARGGRPAASSVIGPLSPKDPWAGHLS